MVFVSCGVTTAPLLRSLAARHTLVVPGVDLAEQLRAHGLGAVGWEALADPERVVALPVAATNRAEAGRAALEQVAAALFTFAGRRRAEAFLPAATRVIEEQLLEQMLVMEYGRSLAASGRLAAVVVHEDVTPTVRGLLEAVRPFGVPSVHVPHGVYVKERLVGADPHGASHTTVIAAGGAAQRAWFAARGVAPERIVVTGNPAWDPLCGRARSTYPPLALPPGRVVTFAASWVGRETPHHELIARQHARWTRAALDAVALLRRRDPGLRLVVKHHPSAPPEAEAAVQALAAEVGVTIDLALRGEAAPVLAASDVLVALPSTIVVESLLLGTPVIVPELDYEGDAVLTTEATGAAVAAAAGQVFDGWGRSAEFTARRADFLARYNGPSDGQAIARVVGLVEELIARTRQAASPRGLSIGTGRAA
jgi:hypothetical protein